MVNTLVHPTKVIDAIECGTSAELIAALENMGMALDLGIPVIVTLLEETLSDGSTAQSILITPEA